MRRRTVILAIAASALALAAGCGGGDDMLVCGGFERQSEIEKTPEGWHPTVVPEYKDLVNFEWVDGTAHSGESCVSIAIDPRHPADPPVHYNWTAEVQGCEAGGKYELSGWVRTQDLAATAVIMVQFINEKRDGLVGFATSQIDYDVRGTNDWTRVGTVFTVPEGTAEVRVRAGIASPENRGGKAWFDDITVRGL